MLLFCLSKDREPAVRAEAVSTLAALPAGVIREYIDGAAPNPLVLDALTLFCRNYPETASPSEPTGGIENDTVAAPDHVDEGADPGEEDGVVEDSEQFLSKYKQAQLMAISEKIKMALSGDKEWRAILVKDANKLVSGSVIKNPRITEAEVHSLVKSGIQNDEIMRLICANKEWIKSYKIRKALIENSRTPVQNAMRYLSTMSEKDLIAFAKSKNISSVVSTMAKRLLFNKKK